VLYDKLCRPDVLAEAWRRCLANGGVAGVDGVSFQGTEAYGVSRRHEELAQDQALPLCIGGSRAAPPEDCAGAWNYLERLDRHKYQPPIEELGIMAEAMQSPEAVWRMKLRVSQRRRDCSIP
jgi:Plasmid pRiA4b ORF-3-like protein